MNLLDVTISNERTNAGKVILAYGRIPLRLIISFDVELVMDDNSHILRTNTFFM